jgi:dolichol-phosphate mannosyltransferase
MISIVIPVYNEEENIPTLYNRITHASAKWGDEYEVVIVDDGSSDESLQQLKMIHQRDPRWKVISFSRNFGHQTAVSAGIFYCHGDVVAAMDADLQDPPEELHRFLEKWRGLPRRLCDPHQTEEGLLKRRLQDFHRVLRWLASVEIPVDAGDFCVMDRAVIDVRKAMPERTASCGASQLVGFRQVGVATSVPCVMPAHRNIRSQNYSD